MSEEKNVPKMVTIRQAAATKILPEHALRQLVKQGKIPHLKCGNRVLVNLDKLIEQLQQL